MRRVIIISILTLMLSQLFIGLASADVELYAQSVKNLSGSYNPETNSITLKWTTRVTTVSDFNINSNKITISKGLNQQNLTGIATINVNDVYQINEGPYAKDREFTYTDTNVSLDKTYRYKVSCGTIGAKWQEIIVDASGVIDEDEEAAGPGGASGDTMDERRKRYEESADWPERLGGSILLAIPNYFVDVLGLDDPLELIYQINLDNDDSKLLTPRIVIGKETNNYLHTFTEEEFDALVKFYDRLNEFVPVYLVVIVVILGVGFLFVSANPNSRLTSKDYIIGVLIGVCTLKFGIYLIAMIFDLNYSLVKVFEWIVGDELSVSFLDSLVNTESNALGSVIVTFLAVFSIGLINWQYTLRKYMLALLIGLIPVVAIIAIMPSRRSAIEYWMREFLAQVFLQASHAAGLTIILLFIHANVGFWMQLVGVMALPAISNVVRRVLGVESFGTGIAAGVGTALGLGSLFALSRILKPDRTAKIPLNAESTNETAGSVGGSVFRSPGNFMGNMAKSGFRAASGISAGVVGGLMTGAATGNPAFGLATGLAAGTAVGGGIVNTAQSVLDNFNKSPAERMEAQGIVDPTQLDDPNQAYEYGKNLFGGGIVGSAAGLGMAAGKKVQSLMGHGHSDIARQVKSGAEQNALNLSRAQQEVADYKPAYDGAKARATYAKNMYDPKSANMKGLKSHATTLESRMYDAETRYAEALDDWHNNYDGEISKPGSINVMQRVQLSKEEAHEARAQFEGVQEQILSGEREFMDATANLQLVEAKYAQRQLAVSGIQQNLSRAGLKKEFENLKAQKQETKGSIDDTWH